LNCAILQADPMDPQEKLTLKSVVKIESEGRWRFVSIKNERRL